MPPVARAAGWGAFFGVLWAGVAATALALGGRPAAFLGALVVGGGVVGGLIGALSMLAEGSARRASIRDEDERSPSS